MGGGGELGWRATAKRAVGGLRARFLQAKKEALTNERWKDNAAALFRYDAIGWSLVLSNNRVRGGGAETKTITITLIFDRTCSLFLGAVPNTDRTNVRVISRRWRRAVGGLCSSVPVFIDY